MALDGRHRYMARVLAQQYAMTLPAVEEVLQEEKNVVQLSEFMQADGPPTLIFFRQARETYNEDGEPIELASGAQPPPRALGRGPRPAPAPMRPPPGPHTLRRRTRASRPPHRPG